MDIKELLGKRIKELRKEKGLTQEQLAETVGIEPNNLSRIEKGRNYPTPENLSKIANALNVSVDKLYILSIISNMTKSKKDSQTP